MLLHFRKFAALLGLFLLLAISGSCSASRGLLWPSGPTPTPVGTVLPPAIPVNFETLNADPLVFRNKMIRVEGVSRKADLVNCSPLKGPQIDWHMIADGFEMNVSGLRDIIVLAPELSGLTVDGVWRLYEGPVGCGKEPPSDFVWYLEVVRIVEPNPFPFVAQVGSNVGQLAEPESAPSGEIQPTTPPESDTDVVDEVPTLIPTETPTIPPTPTATATEPIPTSDTGTDTSADPTASPTTASNSQPTNTPAPTETPTGTPTPTPTEEATTEATATSSGGVGSSDSGTREASTPIPTNTPIGYPGNGGGYP